jgi:hypothetical protein
MTEYLVSFLKKSYCEDTFRLYTRTWTSKPAAHHREDG